MVVGCKAAAAVYCSPLSLTSIQISAPLKRQKFLYRWGHFSLSTLSAAQAAGQFSGCHAD